MVLDDTCSSDNDWLISRCNLRFWWWGGECDGATVRRCDGATVRRCASGAVGQRCGAVGREKTDERMSERASERASERTNLKVLLKMLILRINPVSRFADLYLLGRRAYIFVHVPEVLILRHPAELVLLLVVVVLRWARWGKWQRWDRAAGQGLRLEPRFVRSRE